MDKISVLRGEAYWANVRKPNDLSGKLQMDLGIWISLL